MKSITVIPLIILSLTACSIKPVQSVNPIPKTSTVSPTITQTPQPSQTLTLFTPTRTSRPQSPAEATIEAFGAICEPPARDYDAEISPDGNWIAIACRGKNGEVDSRLRVVSIKDEMDWSIHYADYAKDGYYDRNNMVSPIHWSIDGKYLYVTSESTGSGCCWIGWDLLLVRLNLENGQQTEIANYIDKVSGVNFSFSPSDRYVLYIPQDSDNNLYVLDLHTWKQTVINLEFENPQAGAGYTLMSNDERKIILVLGEYTKEGDEIYSSIVVIDLISGSQKRLLSDIDYYDPLVPISWQDSEHVLLRDNATSWLLNINTAELIEIEQP